MAEKKTTIGLLYRFMKVGKPLIVLSVLLYAITMAMNLFPPFFQQVYTDNIITKKNPEWFWPLIILYTALFVLELIAWLVLNSHRRTLTMHFSLISQSRYIWHVLRLPMSSFRRFSAGDLLARYTSIGTTGVNLFDLAPAVVLLLNIVIFSYLLFVYHWKLGLIELMALATIFLSMRLSTSYQKRKARSMEATDRRLQSTTMAGIRSMETIKSAGAELSFYQRWDGIYAQALNARVTVTRQMILMSALPILVQQVSNALLLCLGTWFILKGELTPGMLLASQGFMSVMLFPLTNIARVTQDVYKAHSVLERQEEVLETDVDVRHQKDQLSIADSQLTKLHGEIELRDVTFGYDRSQPPLINHLSMHIKAGEHVAFVGKSGCGKSTIGMLIAGLYQPWEGEILIDGRPVNQIDRVTLTSSVGVVNQDVMLFEGTIADNIRMWDDSIDDEAMERAAVRAQLHDDIVSHAEGYESLVATGGHNFSSGERQRLEIAAALAKEPTVLLMDEATAELDEVSEKNVMQAVRDMGITMLVIAHRLETIRHCDRIYVIDYGHVVQKGNHESLMADHDGIYYLLNNSNNQDGSDI